MKRLVGLRLYASVVVTALSMVAAFAWPEHQADFFGQDAIMVAGLGKVEAAKIERVVIFLSAGFAIALSLAVGAVATKAYLARPLTQVLVTARRWAKGDTTARVGHIGRAREIMALGREFDRMADAIEAREAALMAARAEAERAGLAKSRFLAAASHDIRQPVQSLMLLLSVLTQKACGPECDKIIVAAHRSLETLAQLLSGLMDVSRLDACAIAPMLSSVDLRPVLDSLAEEYELRAAEKGLTIRSIGDRHAVTSTDALLLERMLRNLIENALRHTRSGGIVLRCRRRGREWRIDVLDSGCGISRPDQPRIFEEFCQLDGGAGTAGGGMGLGLSIVRRLADLLEARITMASRPGCGSRFSIHLAAAAAGESGTDHPRPVDWSVGRGSWALPREGFSHRGSLSV